MIVDKYIKYVENFLVNYYKILLDSQYEKKVIGPFIDKYIDVRYYNNSIYENGYSFIEKLNKELKNVAKEMIKQDEKNNEDKIKRIFSLFGYILYIDDCSSYDNLNNLIETIVKDNNLSEDMRKEIVELITTYIKVKKGFYNVIEEKYFSLNFKRLCKNLKKVTLNQSCRLSPLYSDWAIEKAFSSGATYENRQYLLLLLLSTYILKKTIDLEYNDCYVIDFPITLFEKEKKIGKYIKLLDNKVVKNRINLLFKYGEYLDNMDIINKFISDGFNVSIILDDRYDSNIKILDLFSYVFVYEKYDYYDIIIDSKEDIRAKVVSL